MRDRAFFWTGLLLVFGSLLAAGTADGAGYALQEQSVRQLGTANAGGAAAADDAATVFYNPAGLARLAGAQAVAGVHLLFPSARFRNEGSTDLAGQPLRGGDGGNAGSVMAVPNLYYHRQLRDRLHFGLGVFSPFGLSTEYPSDWVGRYHAVTSELTSLDINPAIAWRATDRLSLGAGIDLQYVKAKLSNAIDFGAIFAALGLPGMAPQQNDGLVTFEGDSWSWGYTLGVLYEMSEKSRAGVAFRSSVAHTLRGEADFSGVPAANPTGRFRDSDVTSRTRVPETVTASFRHDFTPELAAMASVTWTNWSRFDELRIVFDNPAEADAVTTQRWHDTWRYAVGGVFRREDWVLRAGVAYDESPIPDAAHRTPRIPDSDRTWLTGGIGYTISDRLSLEVAYAHLFIRDAAIRKTAEGEDRLRGALTGSWRSHVDIVSAEIVWRLD